jgi:cytochrome c556
MRRTSLLVFCSCALLIVAAAAGCRRATEAAAPAAAPAMPPFIADHTIKDLMMNVVDTNADVVWQSVTTVASDKGLVETRPKNDAEWVRVRQGAIMLAEAANLLMIPGRHVARPGEKSETPGVELEPSEMEELINKDRPAFYEHAKSLYNAAMLAADAADKKDADKVFEVGETIERACESCHKSYWYPNEKIPDVVPSQK